MSKLSDAVMEEMKKQGFLDEQDPRAIPPRRPTRRVRRPAVPPAQEPKDEPEKPKPEPEAPAPRPTAAQPEVPTQKPQAPVQKLVQPGQPEQPQQTVKSQEPAEPAKPAENQSRLQKAQYQVFRMKNRMSKLGIKNELREFLQSLHDFDINVVKNTTDTQKMVSFALPLKGDAESLVNTMKSLIIEIEKLEKIIGE